MSSPSSQKPHQTMASFVLLVLLAVLVVMALTRLAMSNNRQAPTPTPTPTSTAPTSTHPSTVTSTSPTPSTPTSTADVARPRPEGAVCGARNMICVNLPIMNARVDNPVTVSGTAIAFENTIEWLIEDGQETALANGFATTQAPDVGKPGPFTVRAFLDTVPRTDEGVVRVFERSAKDGSIQNEVSIPVRFAQRTTMKRSVYFIDEASANTSDCTVTKAVSVTMPTATAPIEATLRALLRVDSSDTPEGLITLIPDRTRLISLTLTNGVAKVVFDSGLERDGGGSCRVGAIRAQIEATLKQFPSVKTVEISVEGKTSEEALQP